MIGYGPVNLTPGAAMPLPAPGLLALAGFGLLGLLRLRRRR
jgi:MYXO-CTERM domain-containing protein